MAPSATGGPAMYQRASSGTGRSGRWAWRPPPRTSAMLSRSILEVTRIDSSVARTGPCGASSMPAAASPNSVEMPKDLLS